MSVLRSPLRALLLPLAAGSTLLFHSDADAHRAATATVVVGRVSSGGVPVSGARIGVAGRAEITTSAGDGRYALTVTRSSDV